MCCGGGFSPRQEQRSEAAPLPEQGHCTSCRHAVTLPRTHTHMPHAHALPLSGRALPKPPPPPPPLPHICLPVLTLTHRPCSPPLQGAAAG
jgi:hypothetical protein